MRETHRSLRIYLFVVAGFSLYVNLREVGTCGRVGVLCYADALIGILFALGFLHAGVKYKAVVAAGGKSLVSLLRAKIAYNGLMLAAVASVAVISGWTPMYTPVLLVFAVGIAVPVYLLRNVRRLAREVQPAAQPR